MDENNLVSKVEKWTPIRKQGHQKPRWKDKAVGEARLRGARGRRSQGDRRARKRPNFLEKLTRDAKLITVKAYKLTN